MRRFQRCIAECYGTGDEAAQQAAEGAAQEEQEEQEEQQQQQEQTSSHQLQFLAQGLVNVLLAQRAVPGDRRTAEMLFRLVSSTSSPLVQLSTAALLSRWRDAPRWMPDFLADTLHRTLSSHASTALVPKDRSAISLRKASTQSIRSTCRCYGSVRSFLSFFFDPHVSG